MNNCISTPERRRWQVFQVLICLIFCISCKSPKVMHDVLIRQVQIFDNEETRLVDVGIQGDRIAFVGDSKKSGVVGERVIDAQGYILSPGFIDVHTHTWDDLVDSSKNSNVNYLMQGVTTVVTGNDGGGRINVGQTLATFDEQGIGTNAALLVGHGAIRYQVMKMSDAIPSSEQMQEMKNILSQALKEGAFGMSTGLYYTPGNFAQTEEVIELAKVVAQAGGIYDSHIRDESSYSIGLDSAIRECITIARDAGIHVNISHIKALGVDVWEKSPQIVDLISKAQSEGLSLSADQYPYRASGTSITNAMVPRWVFADDFEGNMRNMQLLPRIYREMQENLRRRGGADALLFTDARKEDLYGKTLKEVAEERGRSVMETAMDIIMQGGSRVASFNMNPQDIEYFMQQPWVMTSSDGSSGHPRKYGSYPKKIREYVQEKGTLSLAEMIRKSTALPARVFQIPLRGQIQVGHYADLILFKPEEIQDKATFQHPAELATGMHYVLVNGKIAIEKGRYTGILAGKGLRRKSE